MILNYFGLFGYASVVLWLAVPLLWLLHMKRRPRCWLCHVALAVAVVAYGLALVNSKTHVNRIQIDRSEEIAEAQARAEKARQAALEARGDNVAEIQFAEDSAIDSLDEGGMDDADRKYLSSIEESAEPNWKKEKRTRSRTPKQDDSLEGVLDTTEREKGADTDMIEGRSEKPPILMPDTHYGIANRLDGLNLKLIRLLMLVGLVIVIVDYLKRANAYEAAYCPLPLPSAWINDATPLPPVWAWPASPRRTMPEELEWLVARGDVYLYLTDDVNSVAALPQQSWRCRKPRCGAVDILRVSDDNPIMADFVFETLWYGRACFATGTEVHARRLLRGTMDILETRMSSRARVKRTVHVIWDLATPLPQETLLEFARVGGPTGFSLVVWPG